MTRGPTNARHARSRLSALGVAVLCTATAAVGCALFGTAPSKDSDPHPHASDVATQVASPATPTTPATPASPTTPTSPNAPPTPAGGETWPVQDVLPHFVSGGEGSVDRVVVEKADRRLYLLSGTRIVRSYGIALGREPVGTKIERGDGRTPEGVYRLDYRNEESAFHRSIHISYPSAQDRARAETRGVEPGGDIMLHGLPNGKASVGSDHLISNWTDGCIAVTNEEMDEIWSLVEDGVPIEIRP